jgi:hypothetical protein
MGILRYIVQGIGWEVGRTAAREGIEALENHEDPADPATEAPQPSASELRRAEREREREAKRRRSEIEEQLAEMKRRMK